MTEEQWKPVKGYEGIYEVSSLGRVRSLERMVIDTKGRRHPVPMKMLNPHDRKGYDSVTFNVQGESRMFSIHRLVATAFITNPDNLPVVNHKDENPKNNRADNLEWCTISYNTRYGNGIAKQVANRVYPTKAVEQLSLTGEYIAHYDSIRQASEATGAQDSVISKVCKGRFATAGGYRWKYKE